MYRNGSYVPSWYQERITNTVREFAKAYGLVRPKSDSESDSEQESTNFRVMDKPAARAVETQPALWDDDELSPS